MEDRDNAKSLTTRGNRRIYRKADCSSHALNGFGSPSKTAGDLHTCVFSVGGTSDTNIAGRLKLRNKMPADVDGSHGRQT